MIGSGVLVRVVVGGEFGEDLGLRIGIPMGVCWFCWFLERFVARWRLSVRGDQQRDGLQFPASSERPTILACCLRYHLRCE